MQQQKIFLYKLPSFAEKSARWALHIMKLVVMVHFNAAEHLNNYKGGKISKHGKHSIKTKLKESVQTDRKSYTHAAFHVKRAGKFESPTCYC
jgi:hypothetical protein